MTRYVALLRAVNVGGTAKVAMADLRAAAEAIGLADVATILQSGSLVFSADDTSCVLERCLEEVLRERLGLTTEVMVRSARAWQAAIAGNPFPALAASDPSHLVLLAIKAKAKSNAEAALRTAIVGREEISVAGTMAYAAYPDGIGSSKLTTNLLERLLCTPVTGRNWNTVLKIADLLGLQPGLSA